MIDLLRAEIESEIEALSRMDLGTEEYKIANEGVSKLISHYTEMVKADANEALEKERIFNEKFFKAQEQEQERKNSIWRNVGMGANIVVPTLVTIWGVIYTTNFEREDSYTSTAGRGFANTVTKLLLRK